MGGGVGVNIKLIPTVVPLLSTLVSLYINPIDPRYDVDAHILFNWRYNDAATKDAIENVEK